MDKTAPFAGWMVIAAFDIVLIWLARRTQRREISAITSPLPLRHPDFHDARSISVCQSAAAP